MMIGYIHTKEHIDTVLVELEKFARRLRLYGAISNSWSRLYTDRWWHRAPYVFSSDRTYAIEQISPRLNLLLQTIFEGVTK